MFEELFTLKKKGADNLTKKLDFHQNRDAEQEVLNMGRWFIEQQEKYLEFLYENKSLFEKNLNKRTTRVFKKLAETILGRNPEQCRSHHLKLLRTCKGNFQELLNYVQKKVKMGCHNETEIKMVDNNAPTQSGKTNFEVYAKEIVKKGQGRGIRSQIFVQVDFDIDAIAQW